MRRKRPVPKCRKRQSVPEERSQYLFCLGGDDGDKPHCFSVLETDRSIRQIALELEDFELSGRLSEGLTVLGGAVIVHCLPTVEASTAAPSKQTCGCGVGHIRS